jgi:hypothetical protein
MTSYCRLSLASGITLSLLLLGGCQRELSQKHLYPARGRVLLKGQPAAFVIVHLEPTAPGRGVAAEAMTQQDGTFELRTYSNDEPDGAAPGEYDVILEQFDVVRAVGVKIPPGATPTKLPTQEMNTGVVVEVLAEDNDLQVNVTGEEQGKPRVGAGGR